MRKSKRKKQFFNFSALSLLIIIMLDSLTSCLQAAELRAITLGTAPDVHEGVRFSCIGNRLKDIERGVDDYFASLGIQKSLVVKKVNSGKGTLVYTLATPDTDSNTLKLKMLSEMGIQDETLAMPTAEGITRNIVTVSKKEIALALLQHGRLTEFSGSACDLAALMEHIGIRQNIVAWAEMLQWEWPEGRSAAWNTQYWDKGTPKAGYRLHEAMADAFFNQAKYRIGCYTATKIVEVHGILDYFHRVKNDKARAELIEQRLLSDGEPLVNIEPGAMWDFEKGFDPAELTRAGKILKIQHNVAADNFVPGDWVYFLNTDPASYEKLGYEGSNAIYLGRNKFDDYYNDNNHSYTFEEKLNEVYQWRNGVFSRSRDFANIKPLAPEDLTRLTKTPDSGGILMSLRVYPYAFGFEQAPTVVPTNPSQRASQAGHAQPPDW